MIPRRRAFMRIVGWQVLSKACEMSRNTAIECLLVSLSVMILLMSLLVASVVALLDLNPYWWGEEEFISF